MKKSQRIFSIVLCTMMLIGTLVGCKSSASNENNTNTASSAQTPTTVTIDHAQGTTEVPSSPKRVFVLDLASLDTIDTLGLGEYVAGVQEFRNIPSYLSKYYDDEDVVVLPTAYGGHQDESETDLSTVYNSIDADLIIGGSRQAENYELLSELAPTIIMVGSQDYEDTDTSIPDLLDITSSEATKIASIWGKDTELKAILEDYESRVAALRQTISGKSGIITAPNDRVGGITLSTTSDSFLTELGFINLADTAPEDLGGIQALTAKNRESAQAADAEDSDSESAATKGKTELDPEAVANALKTITDWIEEQNPEYLFIYDTVYTSLDEVAEDRTEYPGVRELTVYKNGNTYFLSGLSTTRGGLAFAESQIAELEEVFLDK